MVTFPRHSPTASGRGFDDLLNHAALVGEGIVRLKDGGLLAGHGGDVTDVSVSVYGPELGTARRLAEARVPLPVVDADRHIVGVLSVRLLLTRLLARGVQHDAR